MFFQQRAGTTQYSFVSATVLIYCGKCFVACVMFLVKRPPPPTSFQSSRSPRFPQVPAFLLPVIPGVLLASADAISFVSPTHLEPATYQIFLNVRIVVVGILWQIVFRRKLSHTQWLALVLFISAGFTKGLDASQFVESFEFGSAAFWVAVQILLG